jgi:NADPH:quinone reductase-like Zn-dependent oxidoreductase
MNRNIGGAWPTGVMKAARLHERGGAETLAYEDAPIPKARAGDALVRVYATGITPAELTWSATYENPDGSSRIPSIPGHEICGVVEAVAADEDSIELGAEVYGLASFSRDGGAAEYVAVSARDLAPKPRTADFVETACLPLSALTAWQCLFDHAHVAAGQSVLIHGGAGGVGAFAIQLARWVGARVIATSSAANGRFLRDLGADDVIDYKAKRFEDVAADVDVILDTVGGETLERSFQVVRVGGVVISLVQPIPEHLRDGPRARGIFFIVEPNRGELIEIARLIDSGSLKPILNRVFPLERAREAFEFGASAHNRGKIVLRV